MQWKKPLLTAACVVALVIATQLVMRSTHQGIYPAADGPEMLATLQQQVARLEAELRAVKSGKAPPPAPGAAVSPSVSASLSPPSSLSSSTSPDLRERREANPQQGSQLGREISPDHGDDGEKSTEQPSAHDAVQGKRKMYGRRIIDETPLIVNETLRITEVDKFVRRYRLKARKAEGPIRICLVTSALSGPTPNGGIGTAFYSLARHLAEEKTESGRNQFQVSVLYAAHPWYGVGTEDEWKETFARYGIEFLALPETSMNLYGSMLVKRAYRIFEYLRPRQNAYDIISYHDHMGIGYYLVLAKRLGLAFSNQIIQVQCHSTIQWADELNRRPPKDHNSLAYYFMEKRSVEWADVRVSPSLSYLNWYTKEGFYDLSFGLSFTLFNTMYPTPQAPIVPKLHRSQHFIFFGRLETRKGFLIFLDALDHLVKSGGLKPEIVTFLGPDTSIDGNRATDIIQKRIISGGWNFDVHVETSFDTTSALKYITEEKGIAVFPTLGDNSPYVIMEIVANNLPLITTDDGGGKEMLRSDSLYPIVPAGDSKALAAMMAQAMGQGIKNMQLSLSFEDTRRSHMDMFRAMYGYGVEQSATRSTYAQMLHTKRAKYYEMIVGVTSHNRPQELIRLVLSLVNQTYPSDHFHIIIEDDGSDHPDMDKAFEAIKEICARAKVTLDINRHTDNSFVGNNRNRILRNAADLKADYVCLMDDDDIAYPHMLATYAQAAFSSNADVLTDFSDNYSDGKLSHRSLAVGDAFAHNFFINNYGKANFCTRPDLALEMGGHHTGKWSRSPYVDWDFFTRASLFGMKIELVPFALYQYSMRSRNSVWYEMTSQFQK